MTKISVLLPFKENYTPDYAGAVSLFVNDSISNSKYKNSIRIFGNTGYKKFLSSNYTNINFKNNILFSTNKLYVEAFLEYQKKINSEIIEVHNRPSYIKIIKKNIKKNILIFS